MRRFRAVLGTILILTLVTVCGADEPKKAPAEKDKASLWMQAKLEYSQNILAGLTRGDFDAIGQNAQKMQFLGYLEAFVRADTPGYKEHVVLFSFANKELVRQAREKNLDGATLAYNQLTTSCVQCHKIVRDSKK